jgi:hypothetical protein
MVTHWICKDSWLAKKVRKFAADIFDSVFTVNLSFSWGLKTFRVRLCINDGHENEWTQHIKTPHNQQVNTFDPAGDEMCMTGCGVAGVTADKGSYTHSQVPH